MIPADQIRLQVREHYARRVHSGGCCGGAELAEACCAPAQPRASSAATSTAYATIAPASAGMEELDGFSGPSLGCGSPLEYARVQPGETVVDLGSGAGREVLLAARMAGPRGRAIGIDMTPEMVAKARENAARTATSNAEFRLGEIEHIPLQEGAADVVISNCVINLVPDKFAAFREAFRILKPGGRLVVSDIVSDGPLPEAVRAQPDAWAACVAGALDVSDYLSAITAAGFTGVETVTSARAAPGQIFSATVRALKPGVRSASRA